jgi:hypothetical protein
MGEEELRGVGIEGGVKHFFGCGNVDFRVFNAEMIPVDNHGGRGEEQETQHRYALVRDFLKGVSFEREQSGVDRSLCLYLIQACLLSNEQNLPDAVSMVNRP